MSYKRLTPCIFIDGGKAVQWFDDRTLLSDDVVSLAKQYCDRGADELIVFDLSTSDEEHDEAIDLIAKEAIKRKTGARALRSIVEEIMLDVMYEVPSNSDIKTFTVTADMVSKKKNVAELIKLPTKNEISKVEEDIA